MNKLNGVTGFNIKPHAVVTGATGFIGSALCKELLGSGWDVSAVIRPDSMNISRLPFGVNKIILNLEDMELLSGSYDVFFHLAWNGSSGVARDNFLEQYKNIALSVSALKAAKNCGCSKFICSGSQAEYGIVKGICTEETLPNPITMYGAFKMATYNICKVLANQMDIEFIWPRIYSVYGIGENPGTLMSYLITTLLKDETPELTACDNMWDFLYISDCVHALRLLAEKDTKNNKHQIYNISYGQPQILKSFVELTKNVINSNANLRYGAKFTDLSRTFWLQPDITYLTESVSFKPEIDFNTGVKKMVEWIKQSI